MTLVLQYQLWVLTAFVSKASLRRIGETTHTRIMAQFKTGGTV